MSAPPPPGLARLLPELPADWPMTLTDATGPILDDRLVAVLEDGDRADLRWALSTLRAAGRDEAWLAAWLRGPGGRRLGRRSRRFWARALSTEPTQPSTLAEALWPL
ncbi:MAG: hypothetical protein AAF772_19790 [Acidobacteriota bacterium]